MLIDAHTWRGLDCAVIFPEEKEQLEGLLEDLELVASNVGSVPDWALRVAGLAHRLEHREELENAIRVLLDAVNATFQLAAAQGDITFQVRGDTYTVRSQGPDDFSHADNWLLGVAAALVLRDPKGLATLLEVDPRLPARSPTGLAPYRLAIVPFLQELLRGEDTRSWDHLSKLMEEPGDSYDQIVKSYVWGLRAASLGQVEVCCAKLVELLQGHRAYFGSRRWSDEPTGLFSLLGTSLLAFIHDRGFSCEVGSDYLAGWLAERGGGD